MRGVREQAPEVIVGKKWRGIRRKGRSEKVGEYSEQTAKAGEVSKV